MAVEVLLFILACFGTLLLGAAVWIWRKRTVEGRSLARYNEVRSGGVGIPETLHPVFDPSRCIGSGACTRICPQGDKVIGRIHERGVLIDPTMCIGHGRCAAECPMGAIRLVFGTSERGVDLPHLKPTFETNIEGLYITGELGGMGLIANAVRQALEGMRNLRRQLPKRNDGQSQEIADVVIIGAGPAGFAAALYAASQNMTYRFLEKEPEIGGAIRSYPRRKIIMTHPVDLPLLGRVHRKTMSKESLIELWSSAVQKHGISVEHGVAVERIAKDEGGVFTVSGGDTTVRGRSVMLAVGRRGVPRRLQVPGETGENVFYNLDDPEIFRGGRVLVVGGGDSAMEAACSIAEETDAAVTLSYRGAAFTKAKVANRDRLAGLVRAGRITALLESKVLAIRPGQVEIQTPNDIRTPPIDDVLILIGGELPTALLRRIGVRIERHFGEEVEASAPEPDVDIFARIREQSRAEGLVNFHRDDTPKRRRIALLVALCCSATVAALFRWGEAYYLGGSAAHGAQSAALAFRSSGLYGHAFGIAAGLLMGVNLLYFARKELKPLAGLGDLRTWLLVHQASGLTAGALLLLHTGGVLKNAFAAALYLAAGVLISTGLVGRYIFSTVPHDPRGRPLTHRALVELSTRMETEYRALFGNLDAAVRVREILDLDRRIRLSFASALIHLFFVWPFRFIRLTRVIGHARLEIGDKQDLKAFKRFSVEMFRLRFQMDFAPKLKAILSTWRMGHAVFALLTVLLVAAHVMVELRVGYRWIF